MLARHPDHPGGLHYLIHAYDFAPLAERGLPAARRYATAAPASSHARHMPAHIFTMLGLWEESIRANRESNAVVDPAHAGDTTGGDIAALHCSISSSMRGCNWHRIGGWPPISKPPAGRGRPRR